MSQVGQYTVPASGTILLAPDGNVRTATIENIGTAPLFVGPIGVTQNTGYKLVNGTSPPDKVVMTLDGDDSLAVRTDGANTGSVGLISEP